MRYHITIISTLYFRHWNTSLVFFTPGLSPSNTIQVPSEHTKDSYKVNGTYHKPFSTLHFITWNNVLSIYEHSLLISEFKTLLRNSKVSFWLESLSSARKIRSITGWRNSIFVSKYYGKTIVDLKRLEMTVGCNFCFRVLYRHNVVSLVFEFKTRLKLPTF